MMNRLSKAEARKLLSLGSRGPVSAKKVKAAYLLQMRIWSSRLNSALTQEDRERASDVIALLNEAKQVLLSPACSSHSAPSSRRHSANASGSNMIQSLLDFIVGVKAFFNAVWQVLSMPAKVARAIIGSIQDTHEATNLPLPLIGVVLVCILLSILSGVSGCVSEISH